MLHRQKMLQRRKSEMLQRDTLKCHRTVTLRTAWRAGQWCAISTRCL